MKTIGGILLILFFLTDNIHSQDIRTKPIPYGLDSVSWIKANKIWSEKCSMITIITIDSTAHRGQLLVVTDSALVLYEDEGVFDPTRKDEVLHYYLTRNILTIFTVDSVFEVSRTPVCAVIGGAVGVVIGTGLHVFLPGNTFHPVFMAPLGGAGVIVGAGLGTSRSDTILADTNWICSNKHFTDSAAPGESELIWSTYDYTIWQDSLPKSAAWTNVGIEVDSGFTFDDLTASSRLVNRAFPECKMYVSVFGKFMFTKYEDQITSGSLFMFNVGYRLDNWLLDGYYGVNSAEVEFQYPIKHKAVVDGSSCCFKLFVHFLKHDRFNVQPVQFSAGMGIAFSTFDFQDAVPGYNRWYASVFGVMAKADLAIFLSQRFAIVMDVQETVLKPIVIPGCDWCQPQGNFPEEMISLTYFQIGLGVRFHF